MIRIVHNTAIIAITLIAIATTACNSSLDEETADLADKKIETFLEKNNIKYTHKNGVYHVVTSPTYGYEVNHGDTVSFWYTGKTFNSNVIFDTNIKSVAINNNLDTTIRNFKSLTVVMDQDNLLQGLHNGLLLCRLGEKSAIYFNPSYGYGDNWNGIVEPKTSLVFNIEIVHVNSEAIAAEKAAIASMNTNSYTLHSNGLYYRFNNDTIGARPQIADTVYAWYKCTLPNGTTIEESSIPNSCVVIDDNITPALKEGLLLLSSGREASLIAPSPMGYGKKGNATVAPYQTLLYEVRLDSIK